MSDLLGLREIRKDRQNLQVSCRYAFVPLPDNQMLKFVEIEAVNRGPKPIEIVAAGFVLSDRTQWSQTSNKLGKIQLIHILQDKDSASYMYDWEEIVKGVKAAFDKGVRFKKAFVRDSGGNMFLCRMPKNFEKDALASQ
jgi:hypothetical protein